MPPCIWASYKTPSCLVLISCALLIVVASWYCIWFLIYCLNAQVELGAYLLLTPPPFLSPPYNSTIQLNMSLAFTGFTSSSCGLGWIQFFATCSHLGIMLFSHYWYMRATWPPLHALWVDPFSLASIWIVLVLLSCWNIVGLTKCLVAHTH